jgi:hypothetical protein
VPNGSQTDSSDKYAGEFPSGMKTFHNLREPRNGKAKCRYFGEIIFIATRGHDLSIPK